LKAGLKQVRFERSIPLELALNLHEYQRDRVVEVHGPPSGWMLPSLDREARSGPFMLKEADRVVAVVDPLANVPGAEYELKGLGFTYGRRAPVAVGLSERAEWGDTGPGYQTRATALG